MTTHAIGQPKLDHLRNESNAGNSVRQSVDRSANAGRGGSVLLVLLVAGILVASAAGIMLFGHTNAEPYILVFLAVLATVGVFSLFALACGILRFSAAQTGSPLIKGVVDGAFDGIVVTDRDGRVIYANAAYLDLIDAADANDMRPVERVFIGDADASEAIYRLLKAAREGKRLQEEVRVAANKGRPARWLRFKIRALGDGKGDGRLTVWSLSDVTRERERQENVFQELQHAIDYLDHAPAGFFSVDANGRHRSISTPRSPTGSIRIWPRSVRAALSLPTWWRATAPHC